MTLVNSYIPDSQLYHDLKEMGRDNFSYDGAMALMEYLEQLSEDIGENIEYDPIAFCCDFAEYSSLKEFNEEYNSADPFDSWDEVAENTTVIEFGNGAAIVQEF